MHVKVKCIKPYWDVQLHPDKNDPHKILTIGLEWVVDKDRADELVGKGLVEIVETEEVENKKRPTKKAVKR